MMTTTVTPKTYEGFVALAREQSRSLGRYAAVVEVVCYMQSRSYTTVMVGMQPIRTGQKRNTFIGVSCQFRNGEPYGGR